jgi:S1-C subfamily serine protease
MLDGLLGAALGAALGLGIAWILAAVAAQAPGHDQLRADIQRSAILSELNVLLPPSGPILNALSRLDPLPSIAGPSPNVAAPAPRIAGTPAVRAASQSVVRVLGTACGLAIEGSGWVAAPGVVVTNAHVIAGEQDTSVEDGGDSPSLAARPLAFDATDDIAVLGVPGLRAPGLGLVQSPSSGTAGAILGYPENGPLRVTPGRIGRTQTVLTNDVYGRGPVSRLLTPLRGVVRPGNSGGPLVDSGGHVLTTVFAGTVGSGPRGGYGVANATVSTALAQAIARANAGEQVSTGPCTGG